MTFYRMIRDETGSSAAEYAPILAIVGTGIALAAVGLSQAISSSVNKASNCIKATANCS